MGTSMEWVDEARAAAQEQVPAPIMAVGFLQPAGSWGSFGASHASPIGGTLLQRRANRKAGGLSKAGGFKPKVAMLAVTADEIYVFSAAPKKGSRVEVGEQLASWPRQDLAITVNPGRVATKVTIDVTSSGEHFELEATMIGGGFNDALLAEITPRS
jgi:hypothetical protein